ncbi:SulP family inorganic anion transporter [Nannocystaceae bacterium ST9]
MYHRDVLARLRDPKTREQVRADLLAGLTISVVLVPQALAYAMLSGVPPVLGLYAAVLPPLVYALLGTSRVMAIGPVALTSLLIASGLGPLAEPESARWIELAALLSFEVGVMFLLLGLVRAGMLVNFLGQPAVLGFNAAAGLLTAASQLRPFFGVPKSAVGSLSATRPWPVLLHLDQADWLTLAVSLTCLLTLLALRRWAKRWPYYLLVCVAAMLAAWIFDLPARGVAMVGAVPRGLPIPSLPSFELATMQALLPAAISIVVIGYASSMSVVKAMVAIQDRVDPDRELFAFGAANLASCLSGSFPVSSGMARSAVAADSGVRTRLAGVVVAVCMLIVLLVAGPLFVWLPQPFLAAVVMLAASSLIDPRAMIELFKTKRTDALIAALTFVATLGIGLEFGLLVGIGTALLFFVARTIRPHTAELGRVPGTKLYRNVERFEVETCPQVGLLRMDAPLYYANVHFLEQRISTMFAARPAMRLLALDCAAINDLDATAVQALQRMIEDLRAKGNDLHLVGAIGPVRDRLVRSGLDLLIGADHMHPSWIDAGPRLLAAVSRGYCEGQCRSAAFVECTLIPRSALVRAPEARFTPQI